MKESGAHAGSWKVAGLVKDPLNPFYQQAFLLGDIWTYTASIYKFGPTWFGQGGKKQNVLFEEAQLLDSIVVCTCIGEKIPAHCRLRFLKRSIFLVIALVAGMKWMDSMSVA